jgi:[amino group carrier protein]-lysine/ornithine hydrolase
MPTAEIDTIRRMVGTPSPSGSERALADWLVGRMTELGYAAHVDAAGNAVGAIGDPAGPTVLLLGHLDTVSPQLPVRLDGHLLHGRGAVDAKGPLAAMVHGAARAAGTGPGRFLVVGAVDEEGASRGAVHLRDTLPRPDAVLIGEPSGVDGVVLGYKGVLRLAYEVGRPAGHSSRPEPGAAEVAAEFWRELRDEVAGPGPLFDRVLPSLLSLRGDEVTATAVVSCRLPPGFDTAGLLDRLGGRLRGGRLRVLEAVPAVRTGRADPVVRALTGAVRRHVGTAVPKVKLGTSDMNVVVPGWQVPTAAYGPGDGHLDHTPHEHLDLRDYLLAIDVLATALPVVAASVAEGGAR